MELDFTSPSQGNSNGISCCYFIYDTAVVVMFSLLYKILC